ncbi:hypothetical protein CKAH01_06749 [Colletotrichum kahawae]|uniref:Uncharacterized protein n=1 Tax=Colletotrichum kahawae TaxID=34407 RepID=A0AAD9Y8W8_COLKA|nr:hypothetical protein CKAH01_06749 [Colletotrichum kahawae]
MPTQPCTLSLWSPGDVQTLAALSLSLHLHKCPLKLPSNQQTHRLSVLKLVTTAGYICKYMADTIVTTITTTTSQPTNSTADTTAATNGLSA